MYQPRGLGGGGGLEGGGVEGGGVGGGGAGGGTLGLEPANEDLEENVLGDGLDEEGLAGGGEPKAGRGEPKAGGLDEAGGLGGGVAGGAGLEGVE